jgi:hypothetical protein
MMDSSRNQYWRLVWLLEDFKRDERIDNEVLFKHLRELLKSRNYKVN